MEDVKNGVVCCCTDVSVRLILAIDRYAVFALANFIANPVPAVELTLRFLPRRISLHVALKR